MGSLEGRTSLEERETLEKKDSTGRALPFGKKKRGNLKRKKKRGKKKNFEMTAGGEQKLTGRKPPNPKKSVNEASSRTGRSNK